MIYGNKVKYRVVFLWHKAYWGTTIIYALPLSLMLKPYWQNTVAAITYTCYRCTRTTIYLIVTVEHCVVYAHNVRILKLDRPSGFLVDICRSLLWFPKPHYAAWLYVCDLLLFLDENRVIPEFRHFWKVTYPDEELFTVLYFPSDAFP